VVRVDVRANSSPGRRVTNVAIGQLLQHMTDAAIITDSVTGRVTHWNCAAESLFGYHQDEAIGLSFEELFPPHLRAQYLHAILSPLPFDQPRPPVWSRPVALPAIRMGGEEITVEVTLSAIGPSPNGAVLAIVRDVTERGRVQSERAQAEETLAASEKLMRHLTGLAGAIGTAEDTAAVFRELRTFVVEFTPSSGLFVSRYDPARRERTCLYAYSEGEEPDVSQLPPMPMNGLPHSQAVDRGQPVLDNDFQASRRATGVVSVDVGLDVDPRLPRAALAVPMIVRGQVVGGVEVQSTQLGAYGPQHITALQVVANLASVALENLGLLYEARALREASEMAQHRFRDLVEGLDAVVWEADAATLRPTFVSRRADVLLGRVAETLGSVEAWLAQPHCWPPGVHEADASRVAAFYARCSRTGRGGQVEYRVHTTDGRLLWLQDTVSLVRDAASRQLRGLLVDVTRRHDAEESMRRSEERFHKAFRASPVATSIRLLADGRYVDVNESFLRQLGFTREEVIGRTVQEVGVWADAGEREAVEATLRRKRWIRGWEITYRTKSGDHREVLLSAELIELGGETCVLSLAHDVTERNRLLEHVQAQGRLLRVQVEELRRSRQQITAAEERLRRQIGEMLHGSVQTRMLVADMQLAECDRLIQTDPHAAAAALAKARQTLEHIREHDVRQASHLLHPSIVRIGLIPAIQTLAERLDGHFDVRLQVDSQIEKLDNPLDNQIDEDIRLVTYRVVEEALGNAVRHAKARRVDVALALEADEVLLLSVRDDGEGFDPEHARHGLGLSSIAGRVDQSGGTWGITSARGAGTTITARLPLRPLHVSAAANRAVR